MTQGDRMTEIQRKQATIAADTAAYEQTSFGRRRVSKLRNWMARLVWLVVAPVSFIYRRLRRPSV
jgi:hypothetical protein